MNILKITRKSDFEKVIAAPLYITGNKAGLQKEIDCNMWCLSFTKAAIEKMTIQDLSQFICSLIISKKKLLHTHKLSFPVLFYIWFDKQALQIRLNCISNVDNKLPFRCTLMLLDSPIDIFKECLLITKNFLDHGDQIEFFSTVQAAEKAAEEKFVLPIFVERI